MEIFEYEVGESVGRSANGLWLRLHLIWSSPNFHSVYTYRRACLRSISERIERDGEAVGKRRPLSMTVSH